MEEKASSKPSMVSRLPKFGARPSGGTTVPVANGSAQATPGHEGKSEPAGKPNGLVRASSFSLKWRKENGSPVQPASPEQGSAAGEKVERGRGPPHGSPGPREIRKPATPVTKARRFGVVPVTISSPKAIPKQASKRSPSPKPTPKQSPSNRPASPQINGARPTQNGSSSSSSSTGPGRASGLLRPRASSSSPRSSRDILSQSSDSLKTLALSPSSSDSMVRSQSFTNFKQLPSPSGEAIPRSFSFNRVVELAKPLANTQLRPPILRTPHVSANGRPSGQQQQQLGKGGFLERPSALGAPGSATPPSALRKPLLPNCVLTKPSGLAYRLTRSAGNKPQRPLMAGRMAGDGKAEEGRGGEPATDSEVSPLTSPDFSADSDKVLCPDNPSEDHCKQREKDPSLPCPGEVLEDMSLSSASSLDRNDTSEEFLDDFDNLGDQSHDGTPDNRQQHQLAASSQARLRSFLNETMDWTGGKADYGVQAPRPPLTESPEPDFPPGSSLELSPSNSSGGTYMWDEEGLEPMGHNSHCCGSYDSEGICGDILSNLDNLESCDLEDDDLMLDVDLSEDVSLCNDADGMAHFERSDRGGRQGHWRRRQHRLNGPDHFHNDNSRPVAYDGVCRVGPRALQQPAGRGDGHGGALDELTLKHMSQDCTFVKNQLLKLKSLLQLEDGATIPDSPESIEDSSALQLQELMREVQDLREELRCKDRTIAQLTQQQHLKQQQQTAAVRCHCQQRATASRMDRRTHHDKSTQTPWRGPAAVLAAPLLNPWPGPYQGPPRASMPHRRHILQPSSTSPSRPHTKGSLARTAHIEDRSDLRPARVESHGQSASTPELDGAVTAALRPLPDPEELSVLLSRHLKIHDNEGPPPPRPRSLGYPPSLERPPGERALQGSRSLTQLPLSPRVLQPPRVHKRVSIPVLTQGDSRASFDGVAKPSLKPGFTANSRPLRQLPPPSRGLPCFNSGPQGGGPSLATMLMAQSKPLGLKREPTHIQGEKDAGLSPRTRTLVPINLLTRFPKIGKAAAQDPEFGPRKSLEEILQAKDLPRTKLT